MKINKVRKVAFVWNGDEVTSISPIYGEVKQNQFIQAMRTIVNEIEVDLARSMYMRHVYGTPGTTPLPPTWRIPPKRARSWLTTVARWMTANW
jgi:hypothetical protein